MLKIEDLISENFAEYPEEVRGYLESFSENLREALKEELVKHMTEEISKVADKLNIILKNGHKGYNNMMTRALLDLYLEIKKEEDFIMLLESLSM